MAMAGIPKQSSKIDVVWVSISSLYDGGIAVGTSSDGTSSATTTPLSTSPTVTVPFLLATAQV
jgi:hypothetical protein